MSSDGPSQKTIKLIKKAAELAKHSKFRYRLGAIAIRNGKIVGRGVNDVKMNGKLFREYEAFSLHAEMACLLNSDPGADTLVVARLSKLDKLASSRPCDKCMAYIKEAKIRKIIYIDLDGAIKVEKINSSTRNEHYIGSGWGQDKSSSRNRRAE